MKVLFLHLRGKGQLMFLGVPKSVRIRRMGMKEGWPFGLSLIALLVVSILLREPKMVGPLMELKGSPLTNRPCVESMESLRGMSLLERITLSPRTTSLGGNTLERVFMSRITPRWGRITLPPSTLLAIAFMGSRGLREGFVVVLVMG